MNIEKQVPDPEQSSDQQDAGFFLSVDLLDEVMGSLAEAYARLLLFEKKKLPSDQNLVENYAARYEEILLLKESFPIDAVDKRSKATSSYSQELSQVRILLDSVT